MTLDKFVQEKEMHGRFIDKIPNKTMKKLLRQFHHIDIYEFYYDNKHNPDYNTWMEIEGMGYGWIWCKYKNRKFKEKLKHNKLKNRLIKYAMQFYNYADDKIFIREEDDIYEVILQLYDTIVHIRVSNNELDWW